MLDFSGNPISGIHILHFTLPDDVQEAYNLIQDLVPTTPQVILSFNLKLNLSCKR